MVPSIVVVCDLYFCDVHSFRKLEWLGLPEQETGVGEVRLSLPEHVQGQKDKLKGTDQEINVQGPGQASW